MIKRILRIKNFKNIGIDTITKSYEHKENVEELLLSKAYKDESMGGLTVIVGENNTGKSNIAKALKRLTLSNKDIFKLTDTPDFQDYEECQTQISLNDLIESLDKKQKTDTTLLSIKQTDEGDKIHAANKTIILQKLVQRYIATLQNNSAFSQDELKHHLNALTHETNKETICKIYSQIKNKETQARHLNKEVKEYNDLCKNILKKC